MTSYYLRSRAATRINQTAASPGPDSGPPTGGSPDPIGDDQAIACSLENPETCEACD